MSHFAGLVLEEDREELASYGEVEMMTVDDLRSWGCGALGDEESERVLLAVLSAAQDPAQTEQRHKILAWLSHPPWGGALGVEWDERFDREAHYYQETLIEAGLAERDEEDDEEEPNKRGVWLENCPRLWGEIARLAREGLEGLEVTDDDCG